MIRKTFLLWLVGMIVMVGCQPPADFTPPTPTPMVSTVISPTATAQSIAAATPTATIGDTATPQATPTSWPSPLPSPVILPTAAPLPVTGEVVFELEQQQGGQTDSLALAGTTLYLASGPRLLILDVANPASPRLIGQSDVFAGIVTALLARDNLVYLGVGHMVLTLDASQPQEMMVLDQISLPGKVSHLALQENILLAVTESMATGAPEGVGQITTVDVTQPRQLQPLGTATLPWVIADIAVTQQLAYVANPASETFYLVDFSQPGNLAGPVALPGAPLVYSLRAGEHTLYAGGGLSNLIAWDITNPFEPRRIAEVKADETPYGAGVVEGFLLAGEYAYLKAVSYQGVDLGALPVAANSIPGTAVDVVSTPIVAQDGYLFLARDGLTIIEIREPGLLAVVGSYPSPGVTDVAMTADTAVFTHQDRLFTVRLPTLALQGVYRNEAQCTQCQFPLFDLTLVDERVYARSANSGFQAIDLTLVDNPVWLGTADNLLTSNLAIDEFIYTIDTNGGFLLFATQGEPMFEPVNRIPWCHGCGSLLAVNDQALFAATNGEAGRLDLFVRQGEELIQRGTLSFPDYITALQVLADTLLLVATRQSLTLVNTADLNTPTAISELAISGGISDITVTEALLLVTTDGEGTEPYLYAVDVSEPTAPRLVGGFPLPAPHSQLAAAGAYVLVGNPAMGLYLLHIQ